MTEYSITSRQSVEICRCLCTGINRHAWGKCIVNHCIFDCLKCEYADEQVRGVNVVDEHF